MKTIVIALLAGLLLCGCAANAQNISQQNTEASIKQAAVKMQHACNAMWASAKQKTITYVYAYLSCLDIGHKLGLDKPFGPLPYKYIGIAVTTFHRADIGQISLDEARHELAEKVTSLTQASNQKPKNDACANWGFQPGTPQYGNCKLRLLSILMRPAPSTTCTFVGNQMNCQ